MIFHPAIGQRVQVWYKDGQARDYDETVAISRPGWGCADPQPRETEKSCSRN